jgi:REase_AHJR-like
MITERELERVAEQYRDEGYAVAVNPDSVRSDGLPGVTADLISTRGAETVVVRVVRSRADVEADPTIMRQAEAVNARRGWRYDLVVLEKDTSGHRGAVVEPTDEQLHEMLARVRKAAAAGFHELALTDACATLEAAMRRVGAGAGTLTPPPKPTELLNGFYSNGRISRAEYDRARQAWAIRNQTVHGFVTPAIDPALIDDVLSLTEKVRGCDPARSGSAA